MGAMLRRLAIAIALLVLVAPAAEAGGRSAAATVLWADYDSPVEQQTLGGATQPDRSLWVVNPTLGTSDVHIWDPDDQINLGLSGVYQPGQEVTHSVGLIGDWASHFIGIRLYAARDGPILLRASIEIEGVVRLETGGAAVIVGPDYDRDAYPFPLIPGSNGGVGVVHRVTFRVWNPTDRRVRTNGVSAAIRLNDSNGTAAYGALWPLTQRGGTYPGPTWYWWVG